MRDKSVNGYDLVGMDNRDTGFKVSLNARSSLFLSEKEDEIHIPHATFSLNDDWQSWSFNTRKANRMSFMSLSIRKGLLSNRNDF